MVRDLGPRTDLGPEEGMEVRRVSSSRDSIVCGEPDPLRGRVAEDCSRGLLLHSLLFLSPFLFHFLLHFHFLHGHSNSRQSSAATSVSRRRSIVDPRLQEQSSAREPLLSPQVGARRWEVA
jgi:hypothetical protein